MTQFPICIILPSFAVGGAEKVTLSLAENINDNGFNVHLIMQNTSGPLKCNISKNRIKNLGYSKFRYAGLDIIKTINGINPKIIFSTFPHITIFLLIFKKLLNKDVLIISREPNMPSQSLKYSPFSVIIKNLYNLYMPQIDGVISSSKPMKDELSSKGINKSKICIISNPINVNRIKNFKKIERYKGYGIRLVFVGRLEYQKGLDRLLPLLESLKNVHLTIIGEGSEENKLKKIINKLNINNKVRFLGHVDFPYPYMAGADCLVLPSRWEGLPNVVLEALYLGTPVITMKQIVGLNEFKKMISRKSLLLCDDIKEFKNSLKKLKVRNDFKKPKIRPNIIKRYNTPEQYTKKVSDFLKKIIHENRRI